MFHDKHKITNLVKKITKYYPQWSIYKNCLDVLVSLKFYDIFSSFGKSGIIHLEVTITVRFNRSIESTASFIEVAITLPPNPTHPQSITFPQVIPNDVLFTRIHQIQTVHHTLHDFIFLGTSQRQGN